MQHSNSETNGEKGVGDYRLDEASSRIRDYVVNGTVFGDTDVLLGLYTGKLDPTSGLPDGFGRLEYTSGAYDCKVYEGNWSNGEWDGYGQVSVTDGGFYEGEFLSGRFHGEGNLTYSDGAKYSGNFVRGERSGTKCTMNFNDGSMYRGVFVNDYPRDGFYTFPDGGYIQTKWIEKQGIDGCDESYLGGNYSSLPNGWKVLIHSAQPYYVNVRNGTSQWERPPVEYRTSRWERLPVEYIGTTNGTPLMHFASRLHRLISYGIVKDAKDALIPMMVVGAVMLANRSVFSRMCLTQRFITDFWYGFTFIPAKLVTMLTNSNLGRAIDVMMTVATVFLLIMLLVSIEINDGESEGAEVAGNHLTNSTISNTASSSGIAGRNVLLVTLVEVASVFSMLSLSLFEVPLLLLVKAPAMIALEGAYRVYRWLLFFGKSNGSFVDVARWYANAKHMISTWVLTPPEHSTNSILTDPSYRVCFTAPLVEEFQFRYTFDKIWHGLGFLISKLMRYVGVNKAASTTTTTTTTTVAALCAGCDVPMPNRLGLGCPRPVWVYFSCLYFGLYHVINWLNVDHDNKTVAFSTDIMSGRGQALYGAAMQCLFATAIAYFLLSPLYLERGFAASFGAHAFWNGMMCVLVDRKAITAEMSASNEVTKDCKVVFATKN